MQNAKHVFVCLALFLCNVASQAAADTLRTVVFSGDAAPGTGNDFGGFLNVVLNNAGQTAFLAGSGDHLGIWSEGGGSLHAVALGGNAAPGTDNFFDDFRDIDFVVPNLSNSGHTVFSTGLVGSEDSQIDGIWIEREGSLELVAGLGNPTPGADSTFYFPPPYWWVSNPALNNLGQTAFLAEGGVWADENGTLSPIARLGSEATDTDRNFSLVGELILPFNDSGQTVFGGCLDNCGSFWFGTSRVPTGVWSGTSDSLQSVALSESPAPGTSAVFSSFFTTTLNNAGQTAFYAELRDSANLDRINTSSGIWSEGSGTLALVARAGDAAPGTDAIFGRGLIIRYSRGGFPVINGAGQTAFIAMLVDSTGFGDEGTGIWSEGGGTLSLVARTGSEAPGTEAEFATFDNLILNGAGQAAFHAALAGSGVDASNKEGIWAQDISGLLKLIVREGDLLDVDDGPGTDFRTISQLGSFIGGTGNEDGRPSGFNELGQLAFSARFTDGSSGVFVSNLVAVPEPSSLALLLLAVFAIKGQRENLT